MALKLKLKLELELPNNAVCAESLGCRREDRRRFRGRVAWSMSRSHSARGNLGSQVARLERKCAFQV